MARPIDAEALEKKISEWLGQPGNGDYYSGYDAALCAVQDLIADTLTLTPPNEWVRVEDAMPEGHVQVLMWSAKWNIAEAGSYYNKHFWVYGEIGDGYIADNITHWMLLPAPPTKEE